MSSIVLNLHLYNMALVLATSTITGIWGLILYFRKKEVINRPWKIALIVTAADGLLQGLLGVTLLLMGNRAPGGDLYYLHYVYGGIVVFALPVAYTYAGKNMRMTILILSIAALVIAAAGARAMMTGLGIGA
jgi:heme A synthase